MHPALKSFLEEFQSLLKTTEDLYNTTKEKFIEVKKLDVSNVNTSELFTIHRKLFQTGYLLMESHLRVDNLRANYSQEQQEIIDKYPALEKKINSLLTKIHSYKNEISQINNSVVSI